MRPFTVGLTGGIASGKSFVESAFVDLGVPVLDADRVSREVVEPGSPGLAAVLERFGDHLRQPDGQLDRRALRQTVFADEVARRDLEHLLHPRIGERLHAWRDQQQAPYVIWSIAILLESRFRHEVDFILVVDVPEALQQERLLLRDGIDAVLAGQMIRAQARREVRRAAADGLIDNSGRREDTQRQVLEWHQHLLQRCHDGGVPPPPTDARGVV